MSAPNLKADNNDPITDDSRRGRCYELAAQSLLDGEHPSSAELVHGYPRLQGGPHEGAKYGHAWIEFKHPTLGLPLVWDAVSTKVFMRHTYYQAGDIDGRECVRYTLPLALVMIEHHEHYGPWEKVPSDASFPDDLEAP